MSRPNILFITTDQQRFDHLGLKGLRAIDTPHLDRLGREGVHFDRAYCPSPVCTPTRVSLLTGRYPSSHLAYTIGVTPDPFPGPTLPEVLGKAGYATALFGKTHFVRRADEARQMAGGEEPDPGFFRNWRGPYLGFETFEGSTGHTTNNIPAMHYRTFLEEAGVDYRQWFPQMRGGYDHQACGSWNIPPEFHDTEWVAGLTRRYIESQDASRPWFCWASFQDPHEPHLCPEPWYSRVRSDQMELPEGYREGEFEDKPEVYRMCREKDFGRLNDGVGAPKTLGGAVREEATVPSCFGEPEKDARKREAMQATLGMVAFLDDRLGSLIRTLEQTGQIDNTIIVWTSDHGEMHGHHGLWGKGLAAFEDCQRVPLLVWGPGRIKSRGTVPSLANLVDLPRTFLSLAGLNPPQEWQGVDLTPLLRGETDTVQDAVLVEMRATQWTLNQHTLITERYKLVVYRHTEAGELYDLQADPDQYHNLWDDGAFRSLRGNLLLRLARLHMEREPVGPPRVSFA
ncbi:MAG: sulfatase-like hydrolase/transferase [Opitutaceae bacterium]